MNHYDTAEIEGTELDKRDVRALTESMTVLLEGGDIYTVVGQNGNGEHRVDTRESRCTCPDYEYRQPEGGCKHLRRVAFATGQRPIPAWVDTSAVDPVLGEHTSGACVAATDGGMVETTNTPDDGNDGDERPSDCDCGDWNQGLDLPCWPCYREGFEEPTPVDE